MIVDARQRSCFAFAGGGTGGHLQPTLSLAREIRRRVPDAKLLFFTTDRPIDERLIRQAFYEQAAVVVRQPVRPFPRSFRDWPRFVAAWRSSLKLCRRELVRHRPIVVIGSGGFGSAPAVCGAKRLGIASVLLNPDAVPGKANRFLASKVDTVIVQWDVSVQHFSRLASVRVLGCPTRPEIVRAERVAGVARFGLDKDKKTLLITGASQGARSVNRAMAGAVGELSGIDGWQFLHLAGVGDVDLMQAAYRSEGVAARVVDYTEHMGDALASSDLVVTRAGASTLAEITARGVAAVLMPYPHHRDGHQYANAAVLTDAGAGVLVPDRANVDDTTAELAAVLRKLMTDAGRRTHMSECSAEIGTRDASERICDLIFDRVGLGRIQGHRDAATTQPEIGENSRRATMTEMARASR